MQEPALAMLEFKSIARGIFTADAVVKKAPVKIVTANAVCPGKYLLIFAGEVADVEEALQAGVATGGDMIINYLFLPYIHRDVVPALSGAAKIKEVKALGVIETFSVVSCVMAADIAAKTTPVELMEIRLANGLGGKAYLILTGELADVEASIAAAREYVQKEGLLAGAVVIASPHQDLIDKGIYW